MFNIYDWSVTPPDPTGVADSSRAINAAIAAANVNGGGVVFVPPGNYAIAATIALDNNVQLVGSSSGDTSITAMDGMLWVFGQPALGETAVMVTNSNNLPNATSSDTQTNMGVRDITLNGNAAGLQIAKGDGQGSTIEFQAVQYTTIERCAVLNCSNDGITVDSGNYYPTQGGVQIIDCTIDVMAFDGSDEGVATGNISCRITGFFNVLVRNNVVGYNPQGTWTATWGNDAFEIFYCNDVTVTGNQITWATDGVDCLQGMNCVITENIVENCKGFALRSIRSGDAAEAIDNLVIANNVVSGSTTAGQISLGGLHATSGVPEYPHTGSPTGHNFTIANNTVKGPFQNAGIICGAIGGACTGNSVDCNSKGNEDAGSQIGIDIRGPYQSITGNEVFDSMPAESPTGVGIAFDLDSQDTNLSITNVVVDSNSVTDTLYAVQINVPIVNVSITNNNLVGGGTVDLGTSFSNTTSRIAENLGWNPPTPGVISQPGFSTSPTTNETLYDCMVTVAGATLAVIKVNNVAIAWPPVAGAPVKGPVTLKVPVNGSIQVTGGSGQSWVWTPQ